MEALGMKCLFMLIIVLNNLRAAYTSKAHVELKIHSIDVQNDCDPAGHAYSPCDLFFKMRACAKRGRKEACQGWKRIGDEHQDSNHLDFKGDEQSITNYPHLDVSILPKKFHNLSGIIVSLKALDADEGALWGLIKNQHDLVLGGSFKIKHDQIMSQSPSSQIKSKNVQQKMGWHRLVASNRENGTDYDLKWTSWETQGYASSSNASMEFSYRAWCVDKGCRDKL